MRIRAFTLAGTYIFLLWCLPAFGQAAHDSTSIHPTEASGDTDDAVAAIRKVYPAVFRA